MLHAYVLHDLMVASHSKVFKNITSVTVTHSSLSFLLPLLELQLPKLSLLSYANVCRCKSSAFKLDTERPYFNHLL